TKRILKLEGMKLKTNERQLAENLTLEVCGQEKIGLIGANGAGKSTLLKEIWKILRERTDIRVGYMPQHYGDLLADESSPLD
ncbi:ATP-binding cassette domain-containing protein, partial [Streptococcus gordonii]